MEVYRRGGQANEDPGGRTRGRALSRLRSRRRGGYILSALSQGMRRTHTRPRVEFLDYSQTIQQLSELGVREREDGERRRFFIEQTGQVAPSPQRILVGDASRIASDTSAERRVETDPSKLPEIMEALIGRVHLQEVVLVPVHSWKKVLDIALFSLGSSELWQEIDAEASLHQSSRDPLAVEPRAADLVTGMARALQEHADSPDEDLTIISTGAALLFEFGHDGVLRIWAPSAVMADEMMEAIQQAV